MFPIPWNFPLRKKNGNLVNIGDAIDEGTELPEHGEGDAGKVLSVDESGNLEWSDDVNTEIQTLTNKLDAEIETRAKTGVHNWLPITLSRIKALNTTGTWNNNVYSINNLTITFNDDLSILVSGTPSENTELQLSDMFSLPAGVDFVMEGTPASGGMNKYWWYLKNRTPSDTQVANMNPTESGNVLHFTVDATNHYYRAYLYIWASQAISVTFYPLIRLTSDTSTAYAPYAMTNRELTDNVQFYNANTDGTVKQNHYAVAKVIGETLAIGGMVTKLVRFSGNYTDFMIISKNDSGYIYCIDFMSNSGFGKIMSFRYNPGTDAFTDEFIIT